MAKRKRELERAAQDAMKRTVISSAPSRPLSQLPRKPRPSTSAQPAMSAQPTPMHAVEDETDSEEEEEKEEQVKVQEEKKRMTQVSFCIGSKITLMTCLTYRPQKAWRNSSKIFQSYSSICWPAKHAPKSRNSATVVPDYIAWFHVMSAIIMRPPARGASFKTTAITLFTGQKCGNPMDSFSKSTYLSSKITPIPFNFHALKAPPYAKNQPTVTSSR